MARMATPEERLTIDDGRVRGLGRLARGRRIRRDARGRARRGRRAWTTRSWSGFCARDERRRRSRRCGSTSRTWRAGGARPDPVARYRETWRGGVRGGAALERAAGGRCWAAASRSAGGSPPWPSPTGCPPPASSSWGTRCIRRASPSGSATSTSTASEVPMLFLQGTKDPFAQPPVLQPVLASSGTRADPCARRGRRTLLQRRAREGGRSRGRRRLAEIAARSSRSSGKPDG